MWTPEEKSRWERNLRAMVESAGNDDPEAFLELAHLATWLNRSGLSRAYGMLLARGYSTRDIARPLGKSHQAVWSRFRRK